MATNAETASWTKWVMGFLILGLIALAGYVGTAVATEDYHDKDMKRRGEAAEKLEAARKETRDQRHTQIMSALTDLKERE